MGKKTPSHLKGQYQIQTLVCVPIKPKILLTQLTLHQGAPAEDTHLSEVKHRGVSLLNFLSVLAQLLLEKKKKAFRRTKVKCVMPACYVFRKEKKKV